MSLGRGISLKDLQQVYSRDELVRLVARRGTAGPMAFLSALSSDLDDAIWTSSRRPITVTSAEVRAGRARVIDIASGKTRAA